MKPTLSISLPLVLTLSACNLLENTRLDQFLSSENAPEEPRSAEPKETKPEEKANAAATEESGSMTGGIIEHMVLFCWKDGSILSDTSKCTSTILETGVAKMKEGTIQIPQWKTTISAGETGEDVEPCGDNRLPEKRVEREAWTVNRDIKLQSNQSATYKKLIAEASGAETVPITVLARVDLDGNGSDEVLFEVNSHGAPVMQPEDSDIVSLVGLRYLAGDVVKTYFFHKAMVPSQPDNGIPYWERGSLVGLTDIEKDGKLEIVVSNYYYEGGSTSVYTFDGSEPKYLSGKGCGN
ncbi:MAG: hypothetical protein VX278_00015 [Myxococcota bacterium]|nr:hypothetical protein [Myxococcota bacterium]